MDWPVRAFLKAALAWLTLGVTLGVAMAVHPVWTVYRPAHVHMNLLGFVTMMIYGVAYHVIPRFSGNRLWKRPLAIWHWWISNSGLALMATGFILRVSGSVPVMASTIVLGVGGTLSAVGAYAFVLNMWKTIDGDPAMRQAAMRAAQLAAKPGALPIAR